MNAWIMLDDGTNLMVFPTGNVVLQDNTHDEIDNQKGD